MGKRSTGILDAFLRNQVPLRSFISRYTISTNDIDDVAQETFLRAYKAEQKKKIDQPKAFLFRVAKNLMLSEFGRKSRKVTDYIEDYEISDVLLEDESLEENIMAQQKLGIYCEAIASLPPQCRRVVLMKKVYAMPHKEIARRLDITISTVEKHLTKGVRHCNGVIADRYNDVDSSRTKNIENVSDRKGRDNESSL